MAVVIEAVSSGAGGTGSTTFTITEPSGSTTGDRLLVVTHQDYDGEDTLTAHADWGTKLIGVDINDGTDYPALAAWEIKSRGASAPNLTSFGKASGSGYAWACYRISGDDDTVAALVKSDIDTSTPPTYYSPPTLTTSAPAQVTADAAGFAIFTDSRTSGTYTPPSGMDEDYDVVPDSFSTVAFDSETGLTAGDYDPGDCTPSSTNNRVSMLTLAVEPEAATYTTRYSAREIDHGSGSGSNDFTSGTFTTVAGSLLVAFILQDTNDIGGYCLPSVDFPTPTTTGTTWVLQGYAELAEIYTTNVAVYFADSPGAHSDRTFAMSSSDTEWDSYGNTLDLVIIEFPDGVAEASQAGTSGKIESSNPSAVNPGQTDLTLDASPDTTSYVVMGCVKDTNSDGGATVGSGWTEVWDQDASTGPYGSSQVQLKTGHTSTTCPWVRLNTTDAANVYDYTAFGIEVEISSGVTLEQEGFRFRTDSGTESNPTWEAAQDTNVTMAAEETKGLRVVLNATGDPDSGVYKLQHRLVGNTEWQDVDLADP